MDNINFTKNDFYPKGILIDKLNELTIGGGGMINTTYADLLELINNNELTPNSSYRITDYTTTTAQADTISAGHDFDVIVTALSTNELSEDAKCVRKAGDTYFENANLEAWDIKYCIDNDTSRFAWADATSGKGVIYYMKDEWNNECPYDFKNIQFKHTDNLYYYTFSAFENTLEEINDASLMKYRAPDDDVNGMTSNVIKPAYMYLDGVDNWLTPQMLNNIIFKTYYNEENYAIYLPSSNSFGVGCHDIFFDGTEFTKSNTFGDSCYSNTFGDSCYSNTFGYDFSYNTFGTDCYSNTFGNECYSNNFGDSFVSNTFGNSCYNNNFYAGINGTTKKAYIRYIVLEDGCRYNNFYSTLTTSGTSYLQRIRIKGLENTTPTDTIITLSTANTKYDWVVAKNSSGIIEQYCLEDAPSNNKTYGRKNGGWTQIDTPSITWSALRTLRTAGTLVPGQSYRITDYVCKTTTTNSQAINNLFDIVVIALDESHLSENASATYHAGVTYFANAKLEAWEIKYCIDNDTTRFAWANTTTGRGVIYYMKDEWGNECPYDFKNIQYLKSSVWVYTFGGTVDNSLSVVCSNNIINPYISSNKQTLNNITFGTNCYSNIFGVNCRLNTFGNSCNSNTFGNGCGYNTFGNGCGSNTFGNDYWANTFGNNCYSNTFGNSCNSNTFGNYCSYNTFGNDCYFNKFGNECFYNMVGNHFTFNTFGYNWQHNTFGNGCSSNAFGNYCYYNTFGNNCLYNTFNHGTYVPSGNTKKNYIRYITLEDGVQYNNFYSDVTTSDTSYLQRIRIKGLENATATNTQITLSEVNTKYEWVVAKNSSGVVKQYCPENLVP